MASMNDDIIGEAQQLELVDSAVDEHHSGVTWRVGLVLLGSEFQDIYVRVVQTA